MSAFIDARTIETGTVQTPDLAIIGGGPAGIALAMALAGTPFKILLLESGGMNFDPAVQKLYAGQQSGYEPLDADRLRYLGGGTNHWGGWCRPMDASDFTARDWVPGSGWPFGREALEPYFPRAQALVEAGAWAYDLGGDALAASQGPLLPLGKGGLYTTWFQFSKMRGDVLPTQFGHRYAADLRAQSNLAVWLNASITGIRLAADATRVDHLDVATLTGKKFTVRPRHAVLACGGIENARLLLASNDVMTSGIGNGADLVGRYFADNPIPRDVATLVVFDGRLAPYYGDNRDMGHGTILRAAFAPTDAWRARARIAGSLTTVEQAVKLDESGRAAVAATAALLGWLHPKRRGVRAAAIRCGWSCDGWHRTSNADRRRGRSRGHCRRPIQPGSHEPRRHIFQGRWRGEGFGRGTVFRRARQCAREGGNGVGSGAAAFKRGDPAPAPSPGRVARRPACANLPVPPDRTERAQTQAPIEPF